MADFICFVQMKGRGSGKLGIFNTVSQFISLPSRKTKAWNISALPLHVLQKEMLRVHLVREESIFNLSQRKQVDTNSIGHNNSRFMDFTKNNTTSSSTLQIQLLLSSWAQIYPLHHGALKVKQAVTSHVKVKRQREEWTGEKEERRTLRTAAVNMGLLLSCISIVKWIMQRH